MELKVKIHSIVDVITNSSTVIYITMKENSIKEMFEIINEILKIADSDKKAEDLFSIEIERNWDQILDSFLDDDPVNEKEIKLFEELVKLEYKESEEYEENVIIPYLKESGRWKAFNTNYDGFDYDSWLIVKAKNEDKSTMEFWNKIKNLFNVEATYDS